ncbi:MAG: FmdB family zinc ribbon protein [Planctomycetota bacterium]
MPLYSYVCKTHGVFDAWRNMSESAQPSPCPTCRRRARRAISTPFIASMNPHNRIAHQRNEKSADEPQVVRKKAHDHHADAHPHRHGGHAHGHAHGHGHGRPWMIGH